MLAVLVSALALAQDPGSPAPDEIPIYLPGGDEAGPTLPSQRGFGPIYSQNRLMRLSPYIGVSGIYDTGLSPIITDTEGNLLRRDAYGMRFNFGVVGSRAYRRSMLNLAYNGNVTHYPNIPFLTMSNHRMNVGFNHSISRKLTFQSTNAGMITNNAFNGAFGGPLGSGLLDGSTDSEVFNTPIFGVFTQQQITYQKTVRFGVNLGGGGFSQRRRSGALVSVNGVSALGSAFYRLSAKTTLGGSYNFGQFFFSNSYGGTNFHTASVELAHRPTKRSQVSLALGGTRIESQSLRRVPLDPLLASLLGRPFGIEAVYRKNYLPSFQFGASQALRYWTFSANASRMVNPGNGLVLTNQRTSAVAGVTFSGIRRFTLNVNANYNEMQGLVGNVRKFRSYGSNVGATYSLARGLSWTSSFGARKFDVGDLGVSNPLFGRTQYRVMTGLRWSPSDIPVPFF
ncbi:MAG: hypothetical protein KIT83_01575 [Bryobacterales bacterium]|nr:hypothetical protein [Bryobacterales bacterium]